MKNPIHSLAEGNRIAFLLISIFLLNVLYPISELGTFATLLFIGVYLVLTLSAIYLVSSNHRLLIIAVLLGIAIAITGGITAISGFTATLWQLAWNASRFAQLVLVIAVLTLFIIESERVTQEVLFAAIAIYFLLAALFTATYTVIESLAPGAFVSSNGAEITWQRLNYFSLVTISTVGYGDITPVTSTAQSLSALEASIGPLYIAVLIGRFVSLYQHGASRQ
jgi:Ion channel